MTYFGKMLKKLRLERGLRQADIAEKLGVVKATISMYESGQRMPNFETAEAIADILNVPLSFLIESPIPHTSAPSGQVPPDFYKVEPHTFNVMDQLEGDGSRVEPQTWNAPADSNKRVLSDFALKATGDSMIGSRILDGDLVFIHSQTDVEDGEIAALIFEGQTMLRRVYHSPFGMLLSADNPKYPPIFVTLENMSNLHIVGKAIACRTLL